MGTQAKGTFGETSWDEKPFQEMEGAGKLVNARVSSVWKGDIEAKGTLQYVMMYRENGSGTFMGLERVIGRIGERSGSFVLKHSGTFEGKTVTADWQVEADSGTGDLRSLSGKGGFTAEFGTKEIPFTFEYELKR